MGCTDLVVALTAVHAVLLLSVQLLDDQAVVEQVTRRELRTIAYLYKQLFIYLLA
jgi:hypothetical protein